MEIPFAFWMTSFDHSSAFQMVSLQRDVLWKEVLQRHMFIRSDYFWVCNRIAYKKRELVICGRNFPFKIILSFPLCISRKARHKRIKLLCDIKSLRAKWEVNVHKRNRWVWIHRQKKHKIVYAAVKFCIAMT